MHKKTESRKQRCQLSKDLSSKKEEFYNVAKKLNFILSR